MPRQAQTFVENSFVKGLITEATGLNFPEQAVTSTDNCVFDERGTVRRRKGVDFEWGYAITGADRTDQVITSYRWDAAAGDGDNSLIVRQVGSTLSFFLTDNEAVSDDLVDTLSLGDYATDDEELVGQTECQFAAGKGYLFVANPFMESIYVVYDPDTQEVSATQVDITVRDFEGVEDGLGPDERPSVLSEEHEYNLMNQGWDVHQIVSDDGGPLVYPLTNWDASRTDFPSNADTWNLFMEANGFDPSTTLKDPLNSPAPKGHFIVDYYLVDRNAVTTIEGRTFTGLEVTTSGFNRTSTVEFFSGRVWYAGTRGAGYSNKILFSQIIERDSQIGQCYQANDPTSAESFDLLPSDGGVILIPDSGTVVKLFAFEDSILVFATNGCWKITGSEGVGFRANDYSVVKISSIPCLSASSFISVAGVPSFWNTEGIYVIAADQTLGTTQLQSMTDTTIRTLYSQIPLQSKIDAKGVYNRTTRVITWVYKSTRGSTLTERYSFDRLLHFNTLSQAFYTWSVPINQVAINGIVVAMSRDTAGAAEPVVDSLGGLVLDGLGEQVYSFNPATFEADVTKFLCSYESGDTYYHTFADEWNTAYVDWWTYSEEGVSYASNFITGYKVHGDAMRKTQPTYVNLYFTTSTVDSSIDFRSLWQYANTGSTGRWSTAQRIVTDSNQYDYTKKRIKTRGSGTAYQFRVDSVVGEPFFLIGWAVFETANAQV